MIPLLIRRSGYGERRSGTRLPRPGPEPPTLRLVIDPSSVRGGDDFNFLRSFAEREVLDLWWTDPDSSRRITPHKLCEFGYEYHAVSPDQSHVGRIDKVPIPVDLMLGRPPDDYDSATLRTLLMNTAMAMSFGADALVSEGPVKLAQDERCRQVQVQSVISVREALALIGLFLRFRFESIPLPLGSGTHLLPRSNLYWYGAQLLLPAWYAWHGMPIELGNWKDATEGQAAIIRMTHVLRARDHCHALSQLVPHPNSDDLIYHFDMFLVSAMGALDCVAIVANRRSTVRSNPRAVGWQREGWARKLTRAAPGFERAIGEGSEGDTLVRVLTRLRNLVHSETLQGSTHQKRDVEVGYLIIPESIETELLDELPRPEKWGIFPPVTASDRTLMSLPRFLEAATAALFVLLNQLMQESVIAWSPDRVVGLERYRGRNHSPELEDQWEWLLGVGSK